VCDYTPEGQPNDDRFNGLVEAGVRTRQQDFWRARALSEHACTKEGKDPPPPVTAAQNRELQSQFVIDTLFDPTTGQPRRKLRDCIRKVYLRRGVTLDLRGSDRGLAHVQLPDGSLLPPPLPDVSAVESKQPDNPVVVVEDIQQPDAGIMRVQAHKKFRKRLEEGESMDELSKETARARKRPVPMPIADETSKLEDGEIEEKALLLAATIGELLPPGYRALAKCPSLSNLVGSAIAWKWDIGWELAQVLKETPKARKYNFELLIDAEVWRMLLGEETYSILDAAPPGSWVCFVQDNT
jgi:hypothetical protein